MGIYNVLLMDTREQMGSWLKASRGIDKNTKVFFVYEDTHIEDNIANYAKSITGDETTVVITNKSDIYGLSLINDYFLPYLKGSMRVGLCPNKEFKEFYIADQSNKKFRELNPQVAMNFMVSDKFIKNVAASVLDDVNEDIVYYNNLNEITEHLTHIKNVVGRDHMTNPTRLYVVGFDSTEEERNKLLAAVKNLYGPLGSVSYKLAEVGTLQLPAAIQIT